MLRSHRFSKLPSPVLTTRVLTALATASVTAAIGCAASSSGSVLRTPVVQDCEKAALEACKEMTDGVVQYLDGQTVKGSRRLLAGGSQNSLEGRQRYATLLEQAQGLPGASKYKKELAEVVLVLAHTPPSTQEGDPQAPQHIITAETDLYQARDGTVPAPATSPEWCSSNFGAASCVMITRGPLFVTDIVSVGHECRGQFASVLRGGSVRAHIEGPFDLHGGRLLLTSADTLVFGQKAAPARPAVAPEAPPVKGKATPQAAGVAPTPAAGAAAPPSAQPEATPEDSCPFYWSGYVPYREVE
jgi:hypothetical protein